MNAYVERFNHTIQEQFVDYHEDSLFDDMALFNQTPYLLAPVLPHHSLGRQSPVQYFLHHHLESRMW